MNVQEEVTVLWKNRGMISYIQNSVSFSEKWIVAPGGKLHLMIDGMEMIWLGSSFGGIDENNHTLQFAMEEGNVFFKKSIPINVQFKTDKMTYVAIGTEFSLVVTGSLERLRVRKGQVEARESS